MIWFAALLSFAWFLVHIIMGGREIALPLRTRSGLKTHEWSPAFLCWHLVSGLIFCMALFFVLGAWLEDASFVLAGTILAAMATLVGVILPPLIKVGYRVLPQGWLFLPVTLAGGWAAI